APTVRGQASDCSSTRAYDPRVVAHEERFVDLDGVSNFRDLGGLPTRDGGVTRSGVLYRSDALHTLEPVGVDRFGELGVRTVIDLRPAGEPEQTGRGLLAAVDIEWVHAPLTVTDAVTGEVVPPSPTDGDLGRHYVESLPHRSATLAQVITQLGRDDR